MPTFEFETDDGISYTVEGDEDTTEAQAQSFLGTLSPDQLTQYESGPDATTFERLHLGVAESGNITTNTEDFIASHFPVVANRFVWDEEGLRVEDAEDRYGVDFGELSPQARRDRIAEVREANIQKDHADALAESEAMAQRGETDYARISGAVLKGVADPVAFVPIAGTAAKAKQAVSVGQKIAAGSKTGAKAGAGFGAAFGASEELADTGIPTTVEEGVDFAKTTAVNAGIGTAGGAVLGGGIVGVSQVPRAAKRSSLTRTLRSPSKTAKLQDKYQHTVLVEKVKGATGANAHKVARENLGMNPEDVYQMGRMTESPIRTPTTAAQASEMLGQAKLSDSLDHGAAGIFSKLTRPIDMRMRELSPIVYGKLMGMEAESFSKMHQYHQETIPFRNIFRKMNSSPLDLAGKQDKKVLAKALYNRDFDRARTIVEAKFGAKGVEDFNRMVTALEQLGAEAKAVGIKFDAIDNYFPRIIKDLDGLKKLIGSKPHLSKFGQALQAAQKKRDNTALSTSEEIKLLNRIIEDRGGRIAKSVGSAKKRRIEAVEDDMLQFYDDPITSIDLHIKDVSAAIARRKFFGKSMKESDNGLEKITDSIGDLLAKSDDLKPGSTASEEVKSILQSRFGGGEDGGSRSLSNARSLVSGITLGNPISGALQLTDIGVTAWVKGLGNTLRGLPRASLETLKGTLGLESSKINADTMGWMMEMAQELSTAGRASNAVRRGSDALMRYGGFKAFDRFGKNVTIQASLQKGMRQLRSAKGTKKFLDEWSGSYSGEDMQKLMGDMKAGRITDIVKQHIFSEVTETQPISRSQMPQKYLDAPNGRVFYQFKTWGLKQLEVARNRVLKNVFSLSPKKQAQGAKEMALMFAYIGSAGVSVKELQGWMLGRDSIVSNADELTDEAFWAVMGNMLFSRYGVQNLTERGDVKGMATNYIVPPALVIPGEIAVNGALGLMGGDEEAVKTLKSTGLGRMFHNWFGGGAEEFNDKLRTKRTEKVLGTDFGDED